MFKWTMVVMFLAMVWFSFSVLSKGLDTVKELKARELQTIAIMK